MTKPHVMCRESLVHDERLALPVEQGVLLWCMRTCVIGMKHGIGVEKRIDEMLGALGIPTASPSLKGFVFALSDGCTRMIEIRCLCQPRIDADELALLDVLSLVQAMRPFEAMLILRGFVTQDGTEAALDHAEAIGTALAQAGRFLPEPEQEMRHFAITRTTPSRERLGYEMLH